jgi:hypothetical protein
MNVFVLQHSYESSNEVEEVKFIGVYSTMEKAVEAIARLKALPGFSAHPDGFVVDTYQLDEDQWTSGFVRA